MKRYCICVLTICLFTQVGCQKKGTAEKAAERVDEVVDNINHGDAPLKEKGTMEKVGETIDDSLKRKEE